MLYSSTRLCCLSSWTGPPRAYHHTNGLVVLLPIFHLHLQDPTPFFCTHSSIMMMAFCPLQESQLNPTTQPDRVANRDAVGARTPGKKIEIIIILRPLKNMKRSRAHFMRMQRKACNVSISEMATTTIEQQLRCGWSTLHGRFDSSLIIHLLAFDWATLEFPARLLGHDRSDGLYIAFLNCLQSSAILLQAFAASSGHSLNNNLQTVVVVTVSVTKESASSINDQVTT